MILWTMSQWYQRNLQRCAVIRTSRVDPGFFDNLYNLYIIGLQNQHSMPSKCCNLRIKLRMRYLSRVLSFISVIDRWYWQSISISLKNIFASPSGTASQLGSQSPPPPPYHGLKKNLPSCLVLIKWHSCNYETVQVNWYFCLQQSVSNACMSYD